MLDMPKGLDGVRVVCLESRRSSEIAVLVRKQGGTPIVAPSMQELALEQQSDALAFADVLSSGRCDLLLLLTGVGARMLFDVVETKLGSERTNELLGGLPIYCRGPKPLVVLKERSLVPKGVAPEPNTSQQLLSLLLANEDIAGKRVYVQEYGRPSPELCQPLTELKALVFALPVYGWGLPDDLEPLRGAARALAEGNADAIVFTSAQQLEHLLLIADELGCRSELLRRLSDEIVIASIGPVTSEGLEQRGLRPDTTPEHPKMGHLVSHLARHWASLAGKRRT